MKLSERLENMEESATLLMAQLARDRKAAGKEVISLSLGEPDFDTPEPIKEAAWRALQEGHTKYTPVPGIPALREAIAEKFRTENRLPYRAENIVVSNGAKQCIANVCLSLINPGDEVILLAPYWVSYVEIVRLAGGVPVELSAGVEADYKVSAEQLAEAISDKTKLVIFSSPCNPTGSVFSEQELRAIASVILEHPYLMILSDEIYEYINFDSDYFSIGAVDGMENRTITVNGFSKGFAMTGWRLGYMGAPDWLAAGCAKVQGQFTSGANSFSQQAAVFALKNSREEVDKMRSAFRKRKDLVVSGLSQIPGLKVNDPMGAFYVFPEAVDLVDKKYEGRRLNSVDDFCMLLLEEKGVAVVPGAAFGAPNCFRVSYAASEEELSRAIELMGELINSLD
ncbi:MAG: pyridoxal phosphate-dependent aminotransferase [Saprospirales bacterium]|nr:MAG: pyridoxal phosphate-dependent aminotransferase [Saprospirales bacterium]